MQVVLLERVAKLGQMGEIVQVRDGYARNFLLPQGKALRATESNLKRFETERVQLETRNLELKAEAEKVAETLEGQTFVVIRSASDGGALYGAFYNIWWIGNGMPEAWVSTWYSRLGSAMQTTGFALFLASPNIGQDGFEWKPGIWAFPFAAAVVMVIWWSGYQYRASVDESNGVAPVMCPNASPIKGSRNGFYHMPGTVFFVRTVPERCFATEQEALDAGFHRPK